MTLSRAVGGHDQVGLRSVCLRGADGRPVASRRGAVGHLERRCGSRSARPAPPSALSCRSSACTTTGGGPPARRTRLDQPATVGRRMPPVGDRERDVAQAQPERAQRRQRRWARCSWAAPRPAQPVAALEQGDLPARPAPARRPRRGRRRRRRPPPRYARATSSPGTSRVAGIPRPSARRRDDRPSAHRHRRTARIRRRGRSVRARRLPRQSDRLALGGDQVHRARPRRPARAPAGP